MEIGYADIVSSTAGHDKGSLFLVIGVEENFVFLVDGKNRTLEHPKRKNKKHVRYMGKKEHPLLTRFRERQWMENKEIRKVLAIHRGESQDNLREANTLGQR